MLCDYAQWKLDNPPSLKGQPYVECDGCDAAWNEDEGEVDDDGLCAACADDKKEDAK